MVQDHSLHSLHSFASRSVHGHQVLIRQLRLIRWQCKVVPSMRDRTIASTAVPTDQLLQNQIALHSQRITTCDCGLQCAFQDHMLSSLQDIPRRSVQRRSLSLAQVNNLVARPPKPLTRSEWDQVIERWVRGRHQLSIGRQSVSMPAT